MFDRYLYFIRSVSVNRIGLTGVILTTSSFCTFVILELARLSGMLTNAYVGLVTYLLFPAMFVVGLILIPIGWHIRKKRAGKSTSELLDERFQNTDLSGSFFGSRVFRTIALFTLLNVIFLAAASSRMLTFMDEPVFCGTACHSVMSPEWTTYQASPHARVHCVECHVGEGVGALVDSKLNGMWQMISATLDLYERPIPTPVHQLRPARETCEKCHWPDKFYGSRLQTSVKYTQDEYPSPLYTTLNLKVDAGRGKDGLKSGIHWHISAANRIRYASVRDERQTMIWVDVLQPDSGFKRYNNVALADRSDLSDEEEQEVRIFDCVDCHNRATHIYEDPAEAVDQHIDEGYLSRSLPYIRREALAAITINYADSVAAMEGIANHLYGFYQRQYPEIVSSMMNTIDSSISVLRSIYNRNIHHGMNVTWGAYPSFIGHNGPEQGCFRCHNRTMVDSAGQSVPYDCTLCHSILAFDTEEPYAYLQSIDTTARDFGMRQYLRDEFLQYMNRDTKNKEDSVSL